MKQWAVLLFSLFLAFVPRFSVGAADAAANKPTHPLLQPVDESVVRGLTILGVLLSAGKDFDTVPDAIAQQQGTSAEKAARWGKVRQIALDKIKVGSYDPANPPVPTDLDLQSFGTRFQDYRTILKEAIKVYYGRTAGEPSPILAQAIAPGGISSPQPPQVALSQVVSGGVPGLNVSYSIAPGLQDTTEKRDFVWTHSTFSASLMVLQEAGKDPKFSSVEAGYSFSDRRTLWDFLADYNNQKFSDALDTDYNQVAADATNIMVSQYQMAIVKKPDDEKAAIQSAVGVATVLVKQYSSLSEQKKIIDKEAKRNLNSFMDFSARARVTPDAEFLDNLADLVDVGGEWSGQRSIGSADAPMRGSFNWTLAASGSAYPTTTFSDFGHANIPNSNLNVLFDGSTGGSLYLPVAGGGTTKLYGSFVARWAPFRDIKEWSAGGALGLIVPVTNDIALAGNYGFQYSPANGWGSNSGITFAKSFN
jgi:hypothetical protein